MSNGLTLRDAFDMACPECGQADRLKIEITCIAVLTVDGTEPVGDTATGQKDLPDLLNLIDVMGIKQKSELMSFAQAFYPEDAYPDTSSSASRPYGASTLPAVHNPNPRLPVKRPATLTEVARRRNDGEEFGPLVAEFLDTFYGALKRSAVEAAACIATAPEPIPDEREHALLGAVGEHLARRWGLAIPPWSNDPSRFLAKRYFTTELDGFKAIMLAQSPLAFRRRLIFTEAEPLRRARMPRTLVPATAPDA